MAAACGGGTASDPAAATATEAPPVTATPTETGSTATPADAAEPTPGDAVVEFDFATGPAVTVAADYQPPKDHVPSTGAYLPANGKPTLVFVDAIW